MSQLPELLKAEESDAAGNHEAAIQWLIAAAQKGDKSAFFQLGRRYLLGDRATLSVPQGIQVLQKGVEFGSANCSLLLSVLHSIGHHVPQDWNLVLKFLVLAADQGSTAAQEQLQLLCIKKKLAEKRSSSREHWIELAQNIDVQYWHTPAQVNLLSQDPVIGQVPDLVSPQMCKWLISQSEGKLAPALVYDSVSQQTIRHNSRSNSSAVFGFAETNVLTTLLQTRIAATMKVAFRQLEAVSVLHYKGGEEIRNHFDFIDPKAPQYAEQIASRGDRIITFLVYLNDNYEGGQTDFPEAGIRHKGVRGTGLFVVNVTETGQPNLKTLHAGLPPTRGEKWIITQFIRNLPTF